MTREEILAEFTKRGIQISLSGCGCCGSPTVIIAIDGEVVLDEDNSELNNFPDKK